MAKAGFKIKGMKKFMTNLNREVRAIQGRTLRGLIEATIVVQRAANPMVPIDLNNLRISWFVVAYRAGGNQVEPVGSFKGMEASDLESHHKQVIGRAESLTNQLGSQAVPIVVFGYSANYAAFVHENTEANFQRPGAKARWLMIALQQSENEVLETIRKYARIR